MGVCRFAAEVEVQLCQKLAKAYQELKQILKTKSISDG